MEQRWCTTTYISCIKIQNFTHWGRKICKSCLLLSHIIKIYSIANLYSGCIQVQFLPNHWTETHVSKHNFHQLIYAVLMFWSLQHIFLQQRCYEISKRLASKDWIRIGELIILWKIGLIYRKIQPMFIFSAFVLLAVLMHVLDSNMYYQATWNVQEIFLILTWKAIKLTDYWNLTSIHWLMTLPVIHDNNDDPTSYSIEQSQLMRRWTTSHHHQSRNQ